MMTSVTSDVLVIGAGVSGLAAAGDLAQTGRHVRVVDKERVRGGRAATHRFADDALCDYGAQYFTAKGERFTKRVAEWLAESGSTLRVWNRGYPTWENGSVQDREPGHPRYAPIDGMGTVADHLVGTGFEIDNGVTILAIECRENRWIATGRRAPDGETVAFSAELLVLSLPPEQLLAIAAAHLPEETRARLEAVRYAPAWTLMLRLENDITANWPALEFRDHPILGWVARDHTKRGFTDAPPVLVAHANGEWSEQNIDTDRVTVQVQMQTALAEVIGEPLPARETRLHRWRYALPTVTFGEAYWYHPELSLAGCGYACGGIRLENALTSGWLLAEAIGTKR